MSTSTAKVTTDRPARYGKQLVEHMSRRHGGEWSAESDSGWMQLGSGRADVRAEGNALVLDVSSSQADELPGLEDAVGRHLVRFGAKDELTVSWVREGGRPGTEQHAAK